MSMGRGVGASASRPPSTRSAPRWGPPSVLRRGADTVAQEHAETHGRDVAARERAGRRARRRRPAGGAGQPPPRRGGRPGGCGPGRRPSRLVRRRTTTSAPEPERLAALMDEAAPGRAGDRRRAGSATPARAARSTAPDGAAAVADRRAGRLGARARRSRSASRCSTSRTCRSALAPPDRPARPRRRALVEALLHAGDQLLPAGPRRAARVGRRAAHRARCPGSTRSPAPACSRARPGGLPGLLDELSDRIRRVHTRVLVDGHPRWRRCRPATGERSGAVGRRGAGRQPAAAARRGPPRAPARSPGAGSRAGIQLVLLDVPMTIGAPRRDRRASTTAAPSPVPR